MFGTYIFVREQFYIRNICALFIQARFTEVDCTEHKCIDFQFRIYVPIINCSEHTIYQIFATLFHFLKVFILASHPVTS